MWKYKKALASGTFDRLHIGHRRLLEKAFSIAERVIVGLVASEDLLKNKELGEEIGSYEQRKTTIVKFLKSRGWLERATIIPLHDQYGPTVTDKTIEALVVAKKINPACDRMNEIRQRKVYRRMDIVETGFVLSEDGKVISSSRIRKGEIDTEGRIANKN